MQSGTPHPEDALPRKGRLKVVYRDAVDLIHLDFVLEAYEELVGLGRGVSAGSAVEQKEEANHAAGHREHITSKHPAVRGDQRHDDVKVGNKERDERDELDVMSTDNLWAKRASIVFETEVPANPGRVARSHPLLDGDTFVVIESVPI